MKSFNKKDVFTLATAEEAKAYISKRGYFGDSFEELKSDINRGCVDNLGEVFPDRAINVVFRPYAYDISYGLFLPADKVKEIEEKKYRPFKSIDEFKKETGLDLLNIVHYRLSHSRSITSTGYGVITEFNTSGSDKTDYITIGDTSFNLNELFNYEYFDKLLGKWHPFGVLENE